MSGRRAMSLSLSLALAAMWCPRLACPAAGRAAHVPPGTRREQRLRARGSGHFKPLVELGCRSSPKSPPSSSSDSTRVAGAAGEGRKMAANAAAAAADLRSEYFQVLLSRRRNLQVPLSVEQGCPVKDPLYQGNGPLGSREVMELCPRKEVENFKEKLVEENFYIITESVYQPTWGYIKNQLSIELYIISFPNIQLWIHTFHTSYAKFSSAASAGYDKQQKAPTKISAQGIHPEKKKKNKPHGSIKLS